eukprot:gene46-1846_t
MVDGDFGEDECRFCSELFAYDAHGDFGDGSKCWRNVLGTVEEKYHATHDGKTCSYEFGDRWWTGLRWCVCRSNDRNAPGCATRTVQENGPHEPPPLWTEELLECRFCSKLFGYDAHGDFGDGSKCSRNVLGTVEEKYHADRYGYECRYNAYRGWYRDHGAYVPNCVCRSRDRNAPGCATRTVQDNGPHEPSPFWTKELHCTIPSVVSTPARRFVLFTMFLGEAMDRDADAPAVWSTPFNSPAEAMAFNASLADGAADALPASSDEDDEDGDGRARKAVAFSRGDVLEALPPDVWLYILSFLRLTELRMFRFAHPGVPAAHGHDGGGGSGGGAAAAPPQGRILAKARRKGGKGRA